MILLLPLAAVLVLNKKLFNDNGSNEVVLNPRTYLTASAAALVIGCYDGFYGPGTGTFLIIALAAGAKLGLRFANAHAKVINLATNIAAVVVFLINGKVLIPLGAAGAVCNMLGGYIGAGLVIKNGSKLTRPGILFVLFLLALKVFGVY